MFCQLSFNLAIALWLIWGRFQPFGNGPISPFGEWIHNWQLFPASLCGTPCCTHAVRMCFWACIFGKQDYMYPAAIPCRAIVPHKSNGSINKSLRPAGRALVAGQVSFSTRRVNLLAEGPSQGFHACSILPQMIAACRTHST